MAGNSHDLELRNVMVDNVSPTLSFATPANNADGTVSLTASSDADTTQVDFERRPPATLVGDDRQRLDAPVAVARHDGARRRSLRPPRDVATDGPVNTDEAEHTNIRVDNTLPPAR